MGEQVLAARERVRARTTLTPGPRSDLAATYRAAGRTAEAITLFEQVLADQERILGPDHLDTLAARGNLAEAYRAAGRTGEAITLGEQVLADEERVLAPDHRDILSRAATSPTPTGTRAAPARRSPCSSRSWPTGNGSWAPTTTTP